MDNSQYSVVKLITGETLLCKIELIEETSEHVILSYPLVMNHQSDSKDGNAFKGTPWCPFSDDPEYYVNVGAIIYVQPMSGAALNYYKRIVDIEDDANEDIKNEEVSIPEDTFIISGTRTLN